MRCTTCNIKRTHHATGVCQECRKQKGMPISNYSKYRRIRYDALGFAIDEVNSSGKQIRKLS